MKRGLQKPRNLRHAAAIDPSTKGEKQGGVLLAARTRAGFVPITFIVTGGALKAMAKHRMDQALLDEFTAERKKAQASTKGQFWNEKLGYWELAMELSDPYRS